MLTISRATDVRVVRSLRTSLPRVQLAVTASERKGRERWYQGMVFFPVHRRLVGDS
jgi:hypothetical protein